jgi:regulator of sigma D
MKAATKDKRYDTFGLKPGPSFSHDSAIVNADSLGYFCIDLCGYLTEGDRSRVLK